MIDLILYRIISKLHANGYSCEYLQDLQADFKNGELSERDTALLAKGYIHAWLNLDMIDHPDGWLVVDQINALLMELDQ